MKDTILYILLVVLACYKPCEVKGQSYPRANDAVMVSEEGKLVWKSDASEAAFFGVNYSAPFAYGYRAIQRKNVDLKEAIQTDVYHMARLGFTAFRVHVWDTEISDVEGNLLDNAHVQAFDFLLSELKKRNIRAILTPIAFWGNGYPEPDYETPGFSHHYGRSKLTVDPHAIAAQENYLRQFLNHVNPYTGIAYKDEPYIIGIEINNEPVHFGTNQEVTRYIDTLLAAVRSTGFTKPVFYNIAQNPHYAQAVVDSKVDGFSFQWYPSGLVSGNTMYENYLHHVHTYTIPFHELTSFGAKPLMVYEFDAADIDSPYMYPAMARSLRTAGFQWATQFAYDPLHIADNNTDYQTHYLNLVYTPQKAISMRIAAKVFAELPLGSDWGPYPQSNSFGHTKVSFEQKTSEYSSEREFYYASTTKTHAVAPEKLQHLAGFGSSPIVAYEGLGAYFLDQLQEGVWRLELYPDAIPIRDSFAPTDPTRDVTVLAWKTHTMEINLPQLGIDFQVIPLNDSNDYHPIVDNKKFAIKPGTYALVRKGVTNAFDREHWIGNLELRAFTAPRKKPAQTYLYHTPPPAHILTVDYGVRATVVADEEFQVIVAYKDKNGIQHRRSLQKSGIYGFEGKIPVEEIPSGEFTYSIALENTKQHTTQVGFQELGTFTIPIQEQASTLVLIDAAKPPVYHTQPNYDPVLKVGLRHSDAFHEETLHITITNPSKYEDLAFQASIHQVLGSVPAAAESFKNLMVEVSLEGKVQQHITVGLTDAAGWIWASEMVVTNERQTIRIPIMELKPEPALLLPRPYPEFLPLRANSSPCIDCQFDWTNIEKFQLGITQSVEEMAASGTYSLSIKKIWLE
jgi:hypothetical protein